MAAERLSMRRLREVLRLKFEAGLSQKAIAVSAHVAQSTVSDYVGRARRAGLGWALPAAVDDDEAVERLLFPTAPAVAPAERPEPDWGWVHRELRRKHVTRMLLWEEYRAAAPAGLAYSQFCNRYRDWAKTLPVTMRQEHRAGERLFVDFSGDGLELVEEQTGQVIVAKLFVAVLGASSYTYVEPVVHEDLPTWIGCHVRAFAYFGGVTEIVVPDNLRSGVKRPDYYDPEINRTYADLAAHYGVAVIPARVRRPRDKFQASHCTSCRICDVSFGNCRRSLKRLPGCGGGNGPVSGARRMSPLSLARIPRSTPSRANRLAVEGCTPSWRAASTVVSQPSCRKRSARLAMP